MTSLDGKKELYQNKPSSTFLSKSRAPYSYVKPDEAPPVALYRPSYAAVDQDVTQTHIDARLGDKVEIRQPFKPKSACLVVGRDTCSVKARAQVRAIVEAGGASN